ncbi:MAG: pyridoxal-phosphate dependent enzyme [Firmicutes bacterium]|nr:pyridoxal-phosphate dependent enzyme [Bacillota bacterium]
MANRFVTLNDIFEARERLKGISRHTLLEPSEFFSQMTGSNVFLKPENLQKTGSFKLRGAYNKIAALGKDAGKGVVAASAGNHAPISKATRHCHR